MKNIVLKGSSDDLVCEIICPACNGKKKLSHFYNASTGKTSFSLYNFKTHYTIQHSIQCSCECRKSKLATIQQHCPKPSASGSPNRDCAFEESLRSKIAALGEQHDEMWNNGLFSGDGQNSSCSEKSQNKLSDSGIEQDIQKSPPCNNGESSFPFVSC